MGSITRRQVATGAAWAVPALAVGAAAPAMAASGCPTITLLGVSAVTGGGPPQWLVQINLSNFQTGAAEYGGGVSAVEVNSNSNAQTLLSGTFSFPYNGSFGSVTAEVYLDRQNPSYISEVTVNLVQPTFCTETFTLPTPGPA